MPFTVIAGTFSPSLGNPDGDSLRFVPDDPSPIFALRRRGVPPKINPTNGSIQLRYEAIDTMEKSALQPFSGDATVSNLDLAGTSGGTTTARGYICSTQIGPNGRPIAFVFAGDPPVADGGALFLRADDIVDSINVRQLALGHAYPLFYDTLFRDLRVLCAEVSNTARAAGSGVWSADATSTGAAWTGDQDTLAPIFPKLWRRIDEFTRDETLFDPATPFRNFKLWLELRGDERVLILSENRFTGFDDLVETTDTTVRLSAEPHDMVIVSV